MDILINFINSVGLIILIPALAGGIFLFIIILKGSNERVLCLLGFLFGGIFGFMLMMIVSLLMPTTSHTVHHPIASLSINSETNGSFMLGSGYINEIEYYIFYKIHGNDRYSREKIRVRGTMIVESNETEPQLRYDYETIEGNIWIGQTMVRDLREVKNRELIVPKGTIIKEFNI